MDGDAVLVLKGNQGTLYDLVEQKPIGSDKLILPLRTEIEYKFAGREIQLDSEISKADYLSGRCFGSSVLVEGLSMSRQSSSKADFARSFTPLRPKNTINLSNTTSTSKAVSVTVISQPDETNPANSCAEATYWTANWRRPQNKKQVYWEGDAFISKIGSKLSMYTEEGKIMGSTACSEGCLVSGYSTTIAGKIVELDSCIDAKDIPWLDTPHLPTEERSEPEPVEPTRKQSFVSPTTIWSRPPKTVAKPLHDATAEGAIVMKEPTKEHAKKYNKDGFPVVPVVLDPLIARHIRPHQADGVKFLYECVMGLRRHEGQGCILADEMGLGKTLQTIALVWTLLKQSPYAGMRPPLSKALIVCPVSLVKNWKAEFYKWLGRDRVGVAVWGESNALLNFQNNKHTHVLVLGYERLKTIIDDLKACVPPIGLIICDEGHRLKSSNKTSAVFKSLRTPRRILLSGTPIQNDLGEFHAMAAFCNPGLLDDYSIFRKVYEIPILKSRAPDCTPKEAELGTARLAQLLDVSRSFVLRRDATILKNYLPPKTEYVVFVKPTELQLSMFEKVLTKNAEQWAEAPTSDSLAIINLLTKISNSPVLLKAMVDKNKKEMNPVMRRGVEQAAGLLSSPQVDDLHLSGKLTALAVLLRELHKRTEEKVVIVSHYVSTLNIMEAYCQRMKYPFLRLDGQTPAQKRQEYVTQFNKTSYRNSFIFLLSSKAGGVGINLVGASRLCLIDQDWNPSHDLQSMARIHRDGQKRPVFIYRFLTTGAIDEKIFQRQVTKLGLSSTLMDASKSGSKSDTFSRKELRDIFRIYPDTPCHTHDLLECECENLDTNSAADLPAMDDVSDSEDEELERGFVVASQVKPKPAKEDRERRKAKAALASLGEWKHINCLDPSTHININDGLLRRVVSENLIETTSTPDATSGSEWRMGALGDGGVSFVFEKKSQLSLDVNVVEPEPEA